MFCAFIITNAQKRSAQKLYDAAAQENPEKAIELYKKALEKDASYADAYIALSRLYEQQQDFAQQIKTLRKGSKLASEKKDFLLAQLALNSYLSGWYETADSALQKLDPITIQQLLHLQACVQFSLEGKTKKSEINAQNLGQNINTKYHDYWPTISIDDKQIITTVLIEKDDEPNFLPQEDFYISEKNNGVWEKSKALSKIINSENNEGAQSLSVDGCTMLFTACNRYDGHGSCDIYFSIKKNGTWSVPKPLPKPINSEYWEGHPSLSADGKELYFSSDRKNGFGGCDIYCAGIQIIGNKIIVKDLKNLGEKINTDKNEISPFMHPDGNTLYFSSDGHIGFGRQDIFYTKNDNGEYCAPTNLGYPINTHNDEIGLTINAIGNKAYFATEREDSHKKDIYSFDIPVECRPQEVSYFKAKIIDKNNKLALNAKVELYNTVSNELIYKKGNTDNILIALPVGNNYALNVSKAGYLFHSENFPLNENNEKPSEKTIELSAIATGERIILRNILFTHNSAELDTNYTAELHKAIALIKENPTLHFEVSGHADSSGTHEYNLKLSEDRARVVYEYFIANEIKAEQISYKGYGCTKPISDNNSKNRRTELLVK